MKSIFPKKFVTTVLITSIWVNISEVFRYFVIVMPQMRKDLSVIPNVAPMDWFVFSIWGIWDTILTAFVVFISWLCFNVFGKSIKTVIVSGTTCWIFFLLFWIGMVNMNLAKPTLLLFTLPLSWIEMAVAAWIGLKLLPDKIE